MIHSVKMSGVYFKLKSTSSPQSPLVYILISEKWNLWIWSWDGCMRCIASMLVPVRCPTHGFVTNTHSAAASVQGVHALAGQSWAAPLTWKFSWMGWHWHMQSLLSLELVNTSFFLRKFHTEFGVSFSG